MTIIPYATFQTISLHRFYLKLKNPMYVNYSEHRSAGFSECILYQKQPNNIKQHCNLGFHSCRNEECVPNDYICDAIRDCTQGEDEVNCSLYSCTKAS